ncbi:hypothetical protein E2C01_090328 [Portunus trituberculatus]|uniref:Uncharacterized protein n=1 Tax=Portunus trituberculatus TaxID=210409 RepID=A0A5B7JL33_PORTR|nr:hypothetical protein [Portunus trituberculatus]
MRAGYDIPPTEQFQKTGEGHTNPQE